MRATLVLGKLSVGKKKIKIESWKGGVWLEELPLVVFDLPYGKAHMVRN